jgi:hypothetical protein
MACAVELRQVGATTFSRDRWTRQRARGRRATRDRQPCSSRPGHLRTRSRWTSGRRRRARHQTPAYVNGCGGQRPWGGALAARPRRACSTAPRSRTHSRKPRWPHRHASYRRRSARGWGLLDPRLQRGVHLLEPDLGLRQHALDEPDEDAAEALRLNEAAAAARSRFDPEAVLPIEDARTSKRPSQRSSRFVSTARTVGLNVVPRAPGGSICTSSRAPLRSSPLIRRMNGFHSGYASRSVTTAHTRAGGASMWISRRSSRTSQTLTTRRRRGPTTPEGDAAQPPVPSQLRIARGRERERSPRRRRRPLDEQHLRRGVPL